MERLVKLLQMGDSLWSEAKDVSRSQWAKI